MIHPQLGQSMSPLQVAIRADASSDIGTGHIMRCLTLAEHLQQHYGAKITFLCKVLPGNRINYIEQTAGFPVVRLPASGAFSLQETWPPCGKSFDWLVVDHYGLDADWERQARDWTHSVLVIDDLADRPHDCDILLDQNYYHDSQARYRHLVSGNCHQLLGPRFALLRPEFREVRAGLLPRRADGKRVLVSLGGSDPENATGLVIKGLSTMADDLTVEVIMGASSTHLERVHALATEFGFSVAVDVSDMASRMAHADMFIGAGGTTTWERMALGLPSIVLAIAENQVVMSETLAQDGYQIYLGRQREVTAAIIAAAVRKLLQEPDTRASFQENAMSLVDGQGRSLVASCMATLGASYR